MSEKVTLDHFDIHETIARAKAVRAEKLGRYARSALGAFGSKLRAHRIIALTAVLLVTLGAKILFLPAAPAEASIQAVPGASWPLP